MRKDETLAVVTGSTIPVEILDSERRGDCGFGRWVGVIWQGGGLTREQNMEMKTNSLVTRD